MPREVEHKEWIKSKYFKLFCLPTQKHKGESVEEINKTIFQVMSNIFPK